ncbi:GtrA family protein [Bacteroides stercorirosoris]|mgnify:FL=1|jgi:putative flippase GtrA|uniref:GtrA family protein n=1 Tax=Bacteroides stercorirosoris TaxID=871324 RepID=A0A1M6J825_9BACE|nr:GtrA family protein [Bacteroides stercorirosoris]OKZ07297.1 MAG: polysaccharide biosynthesis protein GtrA [Bacteroides oleiciplenus]RGX77844.1 GtrA family protein [Bacteroides stercorirosoris]SHJ42822.1 Putative flippase GtrA (transmembrane translocase of bactoprenol-linked glucose) [Bacteroides stercorirosoris]
MKKLKQLPEFVRFAIVGIIATAIHYGVYYILQWFIYVNIAYTIGYIVSFIANFYLSAYFTFGRKPSWGKALGFGGAHLFNYLLHIGLLNFFLWLGLSRPLAPIPVFSIAIPVNFLLVRFVFKGKRI